MTTPPKSQQVVSGGDATVGGTEGGRTGVSIGEVIGQVLSVPGLSPLSNTPVETSIGRGEFRPSQDRDICYLSEKYEINPVVVRSMELVYGTTAVREALRQMEGRPPASAYFIAICRRVAKEGA